MDGGRAAKDGRVTRCARAPVMALSLSARTDAIAASRRCSRECRKEKMEEERCLLTPKE